MTPWSEALQPKLKVGCPRICSIHQANIVTDRIIPFVNEIHNQHDLQGILGYVFDASQAGWNLASRTRASALLRRALAWCTLLKMLISQEWAGIPEFYYGISQFDADAGSWILEQLPEHLAGMVIYQKLLVNLYSSIIQGEHPVDSKTLAASNLATVLEQMLASSPDVICEFNLPYDELAKSFKPESNIKQWNRHATDAELRLLGCLLALRASSIQDQSVSLVKNDIQHWVIKLRSALSEETVSCLMQIVELND